MTFKVYPYKMGSRGATDLARGLGCVKVKPDGLYQPRMGDIIINWGCSKAPNWGYMLERSGAKLLNSLESVALAANKLHAFRAMREAGVNVPGFSATPPTDWEGLFVVRTKLTGTRGEGCYVVEDTNGTIPSPWPADETPRLYVKYIKKTTEYRIHVFDGLVIDTQEKRKRQETPREEVNFQVRNHDNGWVFCRENCNPPDEVRTQAVNAVEALGLDFGAVDVIWNRHQGAFVLEVNTAPGLEGTTLQTYINATRGGHG